MPTTTPTDSATAQDSARRPLRVLLAGDADPLLDGALHGSPRVELHRAATDVARVARRTAPDVLVVATSAAPAVLRAVLALKALGLRTVLVDGDAAPTAGRSVRLLDRLADRRIAATATTLIGELATVACRPGAGLADGPPMTVVATVLNEERTVERLLAQVVAQLRGDDEFVIVDGGSTDATVAVLRRWADRDERLVVRVAPNTNISEGRNVGIAGASNGVVATTDAGCTLAPSWLEALRRPFAETEPPGLVAGNCGIESRTPLEHAQAIACYPDPDESRRPSLFVRGYGRLFGQVFDPTLPFARSLAFTVTAWRDAGGFPEDLRWTEDGVFGRKVAATHECRFAGDAVVTWVQHDSLRATYKMYRQYGMGAAASGDRALVLRDVARLGAYGVGAAALALGGRRTVAPLTAGAVLYCSLPLRRAVRQRAGLRVAALIPVAMATKDFGKVSGALTTRLREMAER
jgi:hypothetical protein